MRDLAMVIVVIVMAGCATEEAPAHDAVVVEHEALVLEGSGVVTRYGGEVHMRWGEGRHVSLHVPGDAVQTSYLVSVIVTQLGDRYVVSLEPERLDFDIAADLRFEVEGDEVLTRVSDEREPDALELPGALQLRITDLGESFQVTREVW